MLNVLWIILKLVLWLLILILGLLVLLLFLVLFCPIRYRANADKGREQQPVDASVYAEVSWLFRMIRVTFRLQNRMPDIDLKILWFSLLKKKENHPKKKSQTHRTKRAESEPNRFEQVPQDPFKSTQNTEMDVTENRNSGSIGETVAETHRDLPVSGLQESRETSEASADVQKNESEKQHRVHKTLGERVRGIKTRFREFQRKLQDLRRKLTDIELQIAWWKNFLTHERTRAAVRFLLSEAHRILRHVMPKTVKGTVVFGFEDPGTTGKILAVLGATMPVHRNRLAVTPLWYEGDVLDGTIALKGRIYGIVMVLTALRILLNRNLRRVYHRFRHKEDKHGRE